MAKQPSLTQSMSELHTWAGLVLGWVLFAIFLTGTLAVFDKLELTPQQLKRICVGTAEALMNMSFR